MDQLEKSMRAAGQAPEIYRYVADHAFFNQLRPAVHDPVAAGLSWERTLAFLKRHL